MKKRQILVELTPLLDVILIILFVIMAQSKLRAEAAVSEQTMAEQRLQHAVEERDQEKAEAGRLSAEFEAEKKALQDEIALLTDRLDQAKSVAEAKSSVLENSLLLVLRTSENGDLTLIRGDDELLRVRYEWHDEKFAYDNLKNAITDELKRTDRMAAFIVFRYDREKIYYAEYGMVRRIVGECRLEAAKKNLPIHYVEQESSE